MSATLGHTNHPLVLQLVSRQRPVTTSMALGSHPRPLVQRAPITHLRGPTPPRSAAPPILATMLPTPALIRRPPAQKGHTSPIREDHRVWMQTPATSLVPMVRVTSLSALLEPTIPRLALHPPMTAWMPIPEVTFSRRLVRAKRSAAQEASSPTQGRRPVTHLNQDSTHQAKAKISRHQHLLTSMFQRHQAQLWNSALNRT